MSEAVFVLGCGPAGLLAAHAAALAGREPVILSRKVKSEIGGAQYLHSAIPGIANEHDAFECLLVKRGDAEGYAEKVYGEKEHPTSWQKYEQGVHMIWNMRAAYDRLWAEYHNQIQNVEITPAGLEDMAKQEFVVSTIPKIATCPDPEDYDWHSQDVWIQYGERVRGCEANPMTFIMSGEPWDSWYRQSNLFGWQGIEYSHLVPGSVKIKKPVSTTYPGVPGVLHMGRYGEWRKDVLIHDVFWRLSEVLANGHVQ